MIVRREQLNVLSDYSRDIFVKRLAEHIKTHYALTPIDTSAGVLRVSELSMDCLFKMVRYSIDRAMTYGLTWESAIAAYSALMFIMGPGFDEHPEIRRELLDPSVPDNSKIDHLCFLIPQSVWQEAREAQGPQAWSLACPSLVFSRQEDERA